MDLFQKCKDFKLVEDIKNAGIYPYFHTLESKQDVVVEMEGGRKIMIGSNNYLGLTSHPEVVKAGVQTLEKYGSGCSGSRFLNGTLDIHTQLEKRLAKFVGKEDAFPGTGSERLPRLPGWKRKALLRLEAHDSSNP